MIADPFYLHHIVTANAEVATAQENLSSDDPDYDEKRAALTGISKLLDVAIAREVMRDL